MAAGTSRAVVRVAAGSAMAAATEVQLFGSCRAAGWVVGLWQDFGGGSVPQSGGSPIWTTLWQESAPSSSHAARSSPTRPSLRWVGSRRNWSDSGPSMAPACARSPQAVNETRSLPRAEKGVRSSLGRRECRARDGRVPPPRGRRIKCSREARRRCRAAAARRRHRSHRRAGASSASSLRRHS
jgi:hypothetical protein